MKIMMMRCGFCESSLIINLISFIYFLHFLMMNFLIWFGDVDDRKNLEIR